MGQPQNIRDFFNPYLVAYAAFVCAILELTVRFLWRAVVQRYDALPIEAQNILSGDL
ncbi:MAG: hypothetical protein AAF787_10460 [Chloroflexota bacterium]